MSSPLTTTPAAGAEATPVQEGERLVLLDTLRGFALYGVFLANVYLWFNGRMFLSRAQHEAAAKGATIFDTIVDFAFFPLISGRFITIFSFLWGLGFAVQLGRAEGRGAAFIPAYVRRLVVMTALGIGHLFLLFQGDIVSTYALMGFTLLLFYKRSDRTLLVWAAALLFVSPIVIHAAMRLPEWLGSPGAAEAAKASNEHRAALRAQVLEAFSRGSYIATVRAGAAYYVGDLFKMLAVFLPVIVGRFLLGLWAGRRGIFHDVPKHKRFFRRLFWWSLPIGVLATGVGASVGPLIGRKILVPEAMPWLPFVLLPMRHLAEVGMAALYVSAITLLFQRDALRRGLSVLAPVGRMALTNYLMQSVMGALVFYGYGLGRMGKQGSAAALGIATGLFIFQIGLSHVWLARFRFGPVEWVTRSLTYGKLQPMRRAQALSSDGAAGA